MWLRPPADDIRIHQEDPSAGGGLDPGACRRQERRFHAARKNGARDGRLTGTGAGIGRTVAMRCAKQGVQLLVSDHDDATGNETMRLVQQAGGQAQFTRTDVAAPWRRRGAAGLRRAGLRPARHRLPQRRQARRGRADEDGGTGIRHAGPAHQHGRPGLHRHAGDRRAGGRRSRRAGACAPAPDRPPRPARRTGRTGVVAQFAQGLVRERCVRPGGRRLPRAPKPARRPVRPAMRGTRRHTRPRWTSTPTT